LKAQRVARMGFLDWNLKTNDMIWSDQIYDLYGVDKRAQESSIDLTMQLVHPDDLKFVEENLEKAKKGEKEYDIDHRKLRSDGKVIWVHAQAELLRDADGNPERLLGTVVDITERKQAEEAIRESEQRLQSIFEATFEGIAIHENGVILDANPAFERIFGYPLSEIIGKSVLDLTAEESRDLVMEKLTTRAQEPFEAIGLRKDGATLTVELIGKRHTYKGREVTVTALHDVTDRKRMEEALQAARDELEGKVERQLLRRNPYGLTFRELTVLHLVAAGESDKQIGLKLGISHFTAQKHTSNILAKMGAGSRTEAAARALREGLLD
jgi:PAS domain S-box-containing protein